VTSELKQREAVLLTRTAGRSNHRSVISHAGSSISQASVPSFLPNSARDRPNSIYSAGSISYAKQQTATLQCTKSRY